MKLIYSNQPAFNSNEPAIFLAGPTPRSAQVKSWRPEAVKILTELGFLGSVLIPEWSDLHPRIDYISQVEWERTCLTNASVIVFWVPRNMETMLALTTNVEFGYWLVKSPQKIIYGRPPEAPHTSYLDWLLTKEPTLHPIPYNDLKSLLTAAVEQK